MLIQITIDQLQCLLDEQKMLCRQKIVESWNDSEMLAELKKVDKDEIIVNKIHEIRDPITGAKYPNYFYVLKKYIK